jgi:hypothetical protein
VAEAVNAGVFDVEMLFVVATDLHRALLRQLLAPDPKQRPSAVRALAAIRSWPRDGAEPPLNQTAAVYMFLGVLLLIYLAYLAGF